MTDQSPPTISDTSISEIKELLYRTQPKPDPLWGASEYALADAAKAKIEVLARELQDWHNKKLADFAERITPEKKKGLNMGVVYSDCGGVAPGCDPLRECKGHPVQKKDSYTNGYNEAIDLITQNVKAELGGK